MWGILPVYWKALQSIPPLLILAQRILWSFVMLFLYIHITGKWGTVKEALKKKREMVIVLGCAILITINWGTYILAVNTGHILESSMGYYINPLVSILLGVTVLKEKLSPGKIAALALAAIGVGYMVIQYGSVPWISLILAFTFGFYGLLKKLTGFEAAVGLFLETVILAPFSLGYILLFQFTKGASFGTGPLVIPVLLVCSGLVTAIPLLLFAFGTKRVELSTIGVLQYLSPTFMLLLGVFVYGESFSPTHLVSFALIWSGMAVYFVSLFRRSKADKHLKGKIAA
jgi:chloramphenicol-sensitive protein RarD